MEGCSPYDIIDWDKLSSNSKNLEKKEDLSLSKTIRELKNKFDIKIQITDKYSKTTGIILQNNLYLPVKPSRISLKYPYLEKIKDTDMPVLDINKTLKLLENVYKKTNLPVKPKYLLLNKKSKDSVIGLLLETNRILPVKPISLKKVSSKLKVSNKFYYEDVNSNNYSENEKIKRINEIKKYKYNLEGFERFKYEFSSYLQDNEKIKNKIIEYLDENKNNLLKKEIDNILKKIIASKKNQLKN